METLIDELPATGGSIVQAEDEMAAMGMVLGASFSGVHSMTATSGPGLSSLMTEMIRLSSMAGLPAVIVDCQRAARPGCPRARSSRTSSTPSTAAATTFRAPRSVFDVVHGRDVMPRAFQIAEKYRLPVLVLSDAYIAQRRQIREPAVANRDRPDREQWMRRTGRAARFDVTGEHGVNPFRVPGTPRRQLSPPGSSTTQGFPTADTAMHQRMNEKRFRKMTAIAAETRDWYRTPARGPRRRASWRGGAYSASCANG